MAVFEGLRGPYRWIPRVPEVGRFLPFQTHMGYQNVETPRKANPYYFRETLNYAP